MPLTVPKEEYMLQGHTACAGCGATLSMRYVLKGVGPKSVVTVPASCWAVIPGEFPATALKVPMLYTTFASAGASISGLREGLDAQGKEDHTVVAFAGDGGTADIGLQGLSAAMERGHDVLYIMYDNEAYMNTGIQRSGSTPYGAWTTTTPVGSKRDFKKENKKIVADLMMAQNVPYVATATIGYPEDLVRKVTTAKSIKGPKFIQILSPCPPGWYYNSSDTIKVSKLAVESKIFPLYEFRNGQFKLYKPAKTVPVSEYLSLQGRFGHLKEDDIKEIEKGVEERWAFLLKKEQN
ncbi:MAG: 3-methyl-2-oxobutanoate dehydrogenase subunit beta [Thermoplasmatales archaeon]